MIFSRQTGSMPCRWTCSASRLRLRLRGSPLSAEYPARATPSPRTRAARGRGRGRERSPDYPARGRGAALDGLSGSLQPRRRRVSPRRDAEGRGRGAAAATSRLVSADYPRRGRGGAATCLGSSAARDFLPRLALADAVPSAVRKKSPTPRSPLFPAGPGRGPVRGPPARRWFLKWPSSSARAARRPDVVTARAIPVLRTRKKITGAGARGVRRGRGGGFGDGEARL